MKQTVLSLFILSIMLSTAACSGEEERRGTPHHGDQGTNETGEEIRPEIDGSEATGQSPKDTISHGDDGATSY